jgi:hypothetical protein
MYICFGIRNNIGKKIKKIVTQNGYNNLSTIMIQFLLLPSFVVVFPEKNDIFVLLQYIFQNYRLHMAILVKWLLTNIQSTTVHT